MTLPAAAEQTETPNRYRTIYGSMHAAVEACHPGDSARPRKPLRGWSVTKATPSETARLRVGDRFIAGEHTLKITAIETDDDGGVSVVGWSSTDGTEYCQTGSYVRKEIMAGRWKPVAAITVSGKKPMSAKTAAAVEDVRQAATKLLAEKRKGVAVSPLTPAEEKVLELEADGREAEAWLPQGDVPITTRPIIGAEIVTQVPEKYSPVLKVGDRRKYFEFDRKIFWYVEIVGAGPKMVTTRSKGAPESYTFDHPRERFVRELAEACLRETGDELKAGAILDSFNAAKPPAKAGKE